MKRKNSANQTSTGRKPAKKKSGKSKSTQLRIIGGDMRGRPIEYHGADFTRPMKDNIRENLFNILGKAVRGAICFDLFSGTGALAFESISRGAQKAYAIEQNRLAIKVISKTAERLPINDKLTLLTGDTFQLYQSLLKSPENDTPWIVFLCPPYVLWEESLEPLNKIIQTTLRHAPPGSVLVAETEKRFDASLLPPGDWDHREYGGTRLAFIEPASRCGLDMTCLPTEIESPEWNPGETE